MKKQITAAELTAFATQESLEDLHHEAAALTDRLLTKGCEADVTSEVLLKALRSAMLVNRAMIDLSAQLTFRMAMLSDAAQLSEDLKREIAGT